MRVAVVSEFYPRAHDPVLGIWAHQQAIAARDAGADVRVLVLYRPVPARAAAGKAQALAAMLRQPRHALLDGIEIAYVPFLSPPRPRSYGSWGSWAAPTLGLALRRLRRRWPFDLVHAHNAVPAGEAVRRAGDPAPLVVSVHGGDVLYTAPRHGAAVVGRVFDEARLVLANSRGVESLARGLGARHTRVVHLGTDLPPLAPPAEPNALVTVGHLVARKRHADVIASLPAGARYVIVGDGPERRRLEALARAGGADVELTGQLPHAEALSRARRCAAFVMPSTEEAFGVAYVEAMAAGRPAIGRRGEPGPEEIAGAGGGMLLAGDGDLPAAIARALAEREALGAAARANVEANFTWEKCGRATVAAYEEALR